MFDATALRTVADPAGEIASGDYHLNCAFSGVEFAQFPLTGREFENCRFSGCRFQEQPLVNGSFCSCEFAACAFLLVETGNLALNGARFQDCKIQGVNFTDCHRLGFSPDFRGCLLENCVFSGNALKKRAFTGCQIRNTDFLECDLREADFSGSVFSGVNFARCNLEKADFRDARDYLVDPFSNRVRGGRYDLPEAQSFLTFLGLKLG